MNASRYFLTQILSLPVTWMGATRDTFSMCVRGTCVLCDFAIFQNVLTWVPIGQFDDVHVLLPLLAMLVVVIWCYEGRIVRMHHAHHPSGLWLPHFPGPFASAVMWVSY